jgi:hypothetical protein
VSRGSKKGRKAATRVKGSGTVPQILVVRPPERFESEDQKAIRLAVNAQAHRDGLLSRPPRTAELFKVEGGPAQGRPFFVLTPRDAGDIYHLAHGTATAVLTTTAAYVRPDPSKGQPATYRHLLPLETFVRHKTFYAVLRDVGDVRRAFAGFAGWTATFAGIDQEDPRVLPLHAFSKGDPWEDLGEQAGKQRFERQHGARNAWTDFCNRTWSVDPAGHGEVALTILGTLLPAGFHWDVVNTRSGTTRLTTAREVWTLQQRGAHTNVYPDAYVRKGKQVRGICVRRWPPE